MNAAGGGSAGTTRVLALSCLFPNPAQPSHGVFVLNRLRAVAERCSVRVIAPIPVYPVLNRLLRDLRPGAQVPRCGRLGGLQVDYPRFFVLPKVLKGLDAVSCLLATILAVRRLERREGFAAHVVDVHWTYPDLVAGCWLARTRKSRLIVTVRGREALYPGEISLRRFLLIRCLRRADAVVTLSDELKKLVAALGVTETRIRTILNGVDGGKFTLLDRSACRARLGIPGGGRVILSVGALVERKGHHRLMHAVRTLASAQKVALYVVGAPGQEGDYSGVLHRIIAEHRLANVHLVGRVDHETLADWYGAADLFCLATEGEGCPNVVLEALSCGTPVVATDVGSIREVIREGENGFIVRARDRQSLRAAIERALAWSWDRSHIAQAMRSWSWERCAEEVVRTYRGMPGTG